LFLLPLVVYTLAQGCCIRDQNTRKTEDGDIDAGSGARDPGLVVWLRALPWITLATLILGLLISFPLLALLPLTIYGVVLAIYRADKPATAFVLWAFALVCLVCFGTEIVYIRDGFEGSSARMNTIFKFYYQAWLI